MLSDYEYKTIPEAMFLYMKNQYETFDLMLDRIKTIQDLIVKASTKDSKLLSDSSNKTEYITLLNENEFPLFLNVNINDIFIRIISNQEKRATIDFYVNGKQYKNISDIKAALSQLKTFIRSFKKIIKRYPSYNEYLNDFIENQILDCSNDDFYQISRQEFNLFLYSCPTETERLNRLKMYIAYNWGEKYDVRMNKSYKKFLHFFFIKEKYDSYDRYIADLTMQELLN
jgi:hypothetical protein